MVKANTPGLRDGRIAVWVNGALVADFLNLRLRDTTDLTIERMSLGLHAGSSPRLNKKWYDNLVVATSYIGPIGSSVSLKRAGGQLEVWWDPAEVLQFTDKLNGEWVDISDPTHPYVVNSADQASGFFRSQMR